jgi:enoyl-CoA hydratase/carnithine racemase
LLLEVSMSRVTVNRENRACWIATFLNPPINLVDPAMIGELQGLVTALETDPEVKVIIFRSADPDFFLAHWDVLASSEIDRMVPGPTGLNPWLDVHVRLSRAPVVSIAQIEGRARGAGSEFVLACDMRFASLETAVLAQPEVGAGVVPGGNPMPRLIDLMGRGRTLEVVLGSDDFNAELAERYGYVNRALPAIELPVFVERLATRLCGFEKYAIAATKALVDRDSLPDPSGFAPALDAFLETVAHPNTQRRWARLLERGFGSRSETEIHLGRALAELSDQAN